MENTERAIKNGQSRDTGNIGHTRRRKTKQKHSTLYVDHFCMHTNTKNINKTWALLETTGGKDGHHNTESRTQRHIIGQHKNQFLMDNEKAYCLIS